MIGSHSCSRKDTINIKCIFFLFSSENVYILPNVVVGDVVVGEVLIPGEVLEACDEEDDVDVVGEVLVVGDVVLEEVGCGVVVT